MKKKPSLGIPLLFISLSFIAGSIITVIYAVKYNSVLDRILSSIAAGLLFIVGSVILIILSTALGKKHNFFLYDFKAKKEITIHELTFQSVAEKLDLYFGLVVQQNSKRKGYFDRFICNHFNAEMPKEYFPLIIPFLLWSVIKNSSVLDWNSFLLADKEAIDFIENELFAIGAYAISEKIQYYKTFDISRIEEVYDFFKSKQTYLEEIILDYIKKHIKDFD